MDKAEARGLIDQAYEAWDKEEWARAAELYERVLAHFPDEEPSAAWWYDAALAHKFLRDWDKAYALGKEAAARAERGTNDPAFWNLGIAATILRDWATARDAWDGFGIALNPGEGPIEQDLGPVAVRLDTDGQQEVVWGRRLCPTRARVLNVPVTGGRRFGEIVVHDGAPNGERVSGGNTYPVFDELLLFEPSDLPTWQATVSVAQEADLEALLELFTEHDFGAEPASAVRMLCACCSEGTVETAESVESGEGNGGTLHAGAQTVSFAAPEAETRRLLDDWAATGPGREWSGLEAADTA
ncbi:tetratricopeptide repeat protein [Streptomyces sp. SID8379]|uniref:tetratricopeptide repeat protein n=1 Tax=unclassified Streptomyces TaxID=2593676 RepID=UPI00038150FB|nr:MULTISPECIES: tetratricopeptide repeat protein [unclassified Streptomyces]MYW64517.1 tetratricopeptide repeat protein [Streptomyces sp. SID8379]